MAGAAAAGSAFGPWGAAAGAVLDLMSAPSNAQPAGPSGANSGGSNVFDSSGWTVATGKSSAVGDPTTSALAASVTSNPWIMGAALAAVVLIAVVWIKK